MVVEPYCLMAFTAARSSPDYGTVQSKVRDITHSSHCNFKFGTR